MQSSNQILCFDMLHHDTWTSNWISFMIFGRRSCANCKCLVILINTEIWIKSVIFNWNAVASISLKLQAFDLFCKFDLWWSKPSAIHRNMCCPMCNGFDLKCRLNAIIFYKLYLAYKVNGKAKPMPLDTNATLAELCSRQQMQFTFNLWPKCTKTANV